MGSARLKAFARKIDTTDIQKVDKEKAKAFVNTLASQDLKDVGSARLKAFANKIDSTDIDKVEKEKVFYLQLLKRSLKH